MFRANKRWRALLFTSSRPLPSILFLLSLLRSERRRAGLGGPFVRQNGRPADEGAGSAHPQPGVAPHPQLPVQVDLRRGAGRHIPRGTSRPEDGVARPIVTGGSAVVCGRFSFTSSLAVLSFCFSLARDSTGSSVTTRLRSEAT